jgi:hypothetical protein
MGSGLFVEVDPVSHQCRQVILIPSLIMHSFHAVTAIRFGVLLVEGLSPDTQKLFDQLIKEQHPRIISLSQLDKEQYETLFRQMLRIAFLSLKEPSQTQLAWIQVLLLYLHEHSHSNQHSLSIAHAADYIRQNLQQFTFGACREGIDRGWISQTFRKYTAWSEALSQTCRLVEAKWLLNSSDKTAR